METSSEKKGLVVTLRHVVILTGIIFVLSATYEIVTLKKQVKLQNQANAIQTQVINRQGKAMGKLLKIHKLDLDEAVK